MTSPRRSISGRKDAALALRDVGATSTTERDSNPRPTTMFCSVALSNDSQKAASSHRADGADSSQAWLELAADYERARAREDSLDRLVEWPAAARHSG